MYNKILIIILNVPKFEREEFVTIKLFSIKIRKKYFSLFKCREKKIFLSWRNFSKFNS